MQTFSSLKLSNTSAFVIIIFGNTIDHAGKLQRHQVDPAATAGPAGSCAKFIARSYAILHRFHHSILWERAAANTGTISFCNAHHIAYFLRRNTQTGANACEMVLEEVTKGNVRNRYPACFPARLLPVLFCPAVICSLIKYSPFTIFNCFRNSMRFKKFFFPCGDIFVEIEIIQQSLVF